VLLNLGVWDYMKEDAVEMKEASIRGTYSVCTPANFWIHIVAVASATDEELAHVKLTQVAERYGQPHCVSYRCTFHPLRLSSYSPLAGRTSFGTRKCLV
jgi:hypothetical protein